MRILVAADDETGEGVVEALSRRTWSENDEFRVATVLDTSSAAFNEAERSSSPYLQERAVGELYAMTAKRLAEKLHALSPNCPVSTCLLEGSAADAIVSEAESWKADLIAIGSHHNRGLTRIFEGSVSENVLKGSKCSLLIIPVQS